MNKFVKTSLIAILALTLSGFVYLVTQKSISKPKVEGVFTTISEDITVKITELNFEKNIKYRPEITAFEATKIATNGEVITSGNGTDAFVLEILGRTAEKSKREFWELIVNNQSAMTGAGSLKLKAGDSIEWKVSKF